MKVVNMGLYNYIINGDTEEEAAKAIDNINQMVERFRSCTEEKEDKSIVNFLEKIQYNIMRISVEKEFYV